MNHLVIGVSEESSLALLGTCADVMYLDKNPNPLGVSGYDTVYIRSHFAVPSMLPQIFRDEIDAIVRTVKQRNPNVKFIDGMETVDEILAFEDKWLQYKTFHEWMPRTELLHDATDISSFIRPIFKSRISSNGLGVTWDHKKTHATAEDWIIQESLKIKEELRIYAIHGEIYPIATVRDSMTPDKAVEAVGSRKLQKDEIEFSLRVIERAPQLDIVGLDVARTTDGTLTLIEVNRSPGFAKFYYHTGINLAETLYQPPTH